MRGEEIDALVLVQRAVDERRLDNTLLTLGGLQQALGEPGTGHGHGEGSRSGAVLSLDDLVATKLHALQKVGVADQVGVRGLREERDDGDAGVAANNDDVLIRGIGVLDLADESRGANDIQCGDAEQAFGVVHAGLLEDLGDDGDGAVDGVRDDEDVGVRGGGRGGLGQVAYDRGVGVEEVVAGHARLTGHAGWDQNDLGARESGCQSAGGGVVASDFALGVDVADVRSDTLAVVRRRK